MTPALLRSSPCRHLTPLPSLPHLFLHRPPRPPAPTGCHHCWLIVTSIGRWSKGKDFDIAVVGLLLCLPPPPPSLPSPLTSLALVCLHFAIPFVLRVPAQKKVKKEGCLSLRGGGKGLIVLIFWGPMLAFGMDGPAVLGNVGIQNRWAGI
jgi:hypothetical protein